MDLLASDFFQRAILGGVLIGVTAPLMGMFLVLRRLSMIGDTLSHVSIAGVALGFLIEVYPLFTGLLFALGAALAIEWLRKVFRSYAELSIAIIMSGGVALASLLFTLGMSLNMNVMSYLFGSIYTLNNTDLWIVAGVTAIVFTVVLFHFKELFLLSFDEDTAAVNGLPVRYLNLLLTVLTALVIGVSIKIMGALLVSALLTIPVACSLVLSRGFKITMLLAVFFSEAAVLSGLLLAGFWNLAPGATIVLLLIALLIGMLAARLLASLVTKRGLKV